VRRHYEPARSSFFQWLDRLWGGRSAINWRADVMLLDVETGQDLTLQTRGAYERVQSILSADSASLATVSEDGSIQVWDIPPRKSVRQFAGWSALLATLIALGAWWRMHRKRQRSAPNAHSDALVAAPAHQIP